MAYRIEQIDVDGGVGVEEVQQSEIVLQDRLMQKTALVLHVTMPATIRHPPHSQKRRISSAERSCKCCSCRKQPATEHHDDPTSHTNMEKMHLCGR